jgi:DNA-binding response OmpR family regulator
MQSVALLLLQKEERAMAAKTVLAVDTGAHTLVEHQAELKKEGIMSLRAHTMREAISRLQSGENYLYVIINEDSIPDFMDSLPDLCRIVRTHVFVISHSYDKSKHAMAMRLGADAYVPYGQTAKEDNDLAFVHLDFVPKWKQREAEQATFLVGGEIALSPIHRKVYMRANPVDLRKKDFDILHYFISNIGIALSHQQILHKIWGRGYDEAEHYLLWNHVYILRRVIETATGSGEYIRTEKDYGYRFQPPQDALHFDMAQ